MPRCLVFILLDQQSMWFLLVLIVTPPITIQFMQAMYTTCLPLPVRPSDSHAKQKSWVDCLQKCHRYQDHQKGLFPPDSRPLCLQSPQSDKRDAPIVLSKAFTPTQEPITLAFLEYNSDFGPCSSAIGRSHRLTLVHPSRLYHPSRNTRPILAYPPTQKGSHLTLTASRYKKAANRVHPIRTTLPEEHHYSP